MCPQTLIDYLFLKVGLVTVITMNILEVVTSKSYPDCKVLSLWQR